MMTRGISIQLLSTMITVLSLFQFHIFGLAKLCWKIFCRAYYPDRVIIRDNRSNQINYFHVHL
uniref:Uncharacterized protein n=1 Tax=Rhizophora mucronata TaxID=61149 RepID=A0A2P2R2N6_RHIMU